jgi:23S rRNA (guanosine2251-2'-O)-methyltransferase
MSAKPDVIAGRIPVLESLRANKRSARRLFLLESGRDLGVIENAAGKVPVEKKKRRELDRLAGGATHQGVVLWADPLPVCDLECWLDRLDSPDAVAVALDGIEDPHNFGAIVRSASACGASCVIFARDRSAPLSTAAMKAAAGAMEHIDLICVNNLNRALEELKKAGFWTAALEADGEKRIWDADLTGRMALVIGSEGRGVRRLVRKNCDMRLRIPLSGPVTSLNASVSAAAVLVECLRQRQAGAEKGKA